jgi:anti-sigma factor RsiW
MVRLVDACLRFDRWLTPYLDGELDAVHCLEVEQHLDGCEQCRERVSFGRAMRGSLRVVGRSRAPAGLRERLGAALDAERAESEGVAPVAAQADRPSKRGSAERSSSSRAAARAASAAAVEPRPEPRSDEQVVELAAHKAQAQGAQLVKLRYIFPLAAAAMFMLILGGVWHRGELGPGQRPTAGAAATTGQGQSEAARSEPKLAPAFPISFPGQSESSADDGSSLNPTSEIAQASALAPLDGLIEDLVAHHASPQPPETTDPRGLERFDRDVGVRVARPQFESFGARYLGARMRPVIGNQAAVLQYVLRNSHRVTVYVFDPQRVPMQARLLQPRDVGTHHLFVGRLRGYSVAASAGNGVGYALASDLTDEESSKLVLAATRR